MNFQLHNKVLVLRNKPLKYFVRLPHKLKKETENRKQNVSADIVSFLENDKEYSKLKDNIPRALLKKYKTPESMYLINKNSAKLIASTIKEHLIPKSAIVEVNPGFCFLTEELLKFHKGNVHIYESSHSFKTFTEQMNNKYGSKIVSKVADFFGMPKLAFQDKMDQGTRVRDLLGDLASEEQDRVLQIIGAMPGLYFMKYLLTSILFHNSTYLMGRADLYIVMPGHQYQFLTDKQIQDCKHKSMPSLFQLLFEYKLLDKVPKLHYLPWSHNNNIKKNLSIFDEHYMYIVNIKQKDTLPCHPDYLPLLWYFFRPHMISKSTRVIPMLEQWIPGCGVWLITGQDPPDTNKLLGPTDKDAKLPHMTIFTEFGDLTLHQKLTVFKKFISWPEFEQCLFKVTMENNLPKFITAVESEDKEHRSSNHIDIEDDDIHETT